MALRLRLISLLHVPKAVMTNPRIPQLFLGRVMVEAERVIWQRYLRVTVRSVVCASWGNSRFKANPQFANGEHEAAFLSL